MMYISIDVFLSMSIALLNTLQRIFVLLNACTFFSKTVFKQEVIIMMCKRQNGRTVFLGTSHNVGPNSRR